MTNMLNQKSIHVESTVHAGLHTLQTLQKLVGQVSVVLNEAGEAVIQSSHGVNDIAASVGEQSLASGDIARNVERIAQMSEENYRAMETSNKGIVRLQELAGELRASVSRFAIA